MAKFSVWTTEEVKHLLSLYGNRETQKKLCGSYRNLEVYQDIAVKLASRGFNKTAHQCRMKVKNMKTKYWKAKEHNQNGTRTFKCPFYKELDAILENRPTSQEEDLEGVVVLYSQGGTGLATVTLKVRNDLDPTFQPNQISVSVPPGSSVYTLLLQASADNPNFTFQAEYYGSQSSHMITSINGVAANVDDRTFWRFENRRKVRFDRGKSEGYIVEPFFSFSGVDLISVFDGDVIVFRFKHYDPPSTDDPASDCDD
ncbi:zinc finger and SCAN domain-containing protein 29-like [Branchiostoma lanceolatum]|uniref:zinc finger and SCAN domain-containing protein 29-like n=1 Tax=Branchiostoma lanceolatum TaxID=7740 RepID=UPI0034548528